jgi:hypothetical protein
MRIVVLFRELDGGVPLLEWLEKQSDKVKAKCLVKVERLAELGYELRRPEADLLREGIYELRVRWTVRTFGCCTSSTSRKRPYSRTG